MNFDEISLKMILASLLFVALMGTLDIFLNSQETMASCRQHHTYETCADALNR